MEPIKFFDSLAHLEPHCNGCDTVIHYGENTAYDDGLGTHKCNCCGKAVD